MYYCIKPIERLTGLQLDLHVYTADPDLNQDPASLRCCLYKWSLHCSLPDLLFCLLYKHTNDDLFDDFGKISGHFPTIT